ncbi:HAD-IIB family hydrolase [Bosea sp. 685]|uniref:HAD-IIB family hydrolase n=1 Tax=Bosea sp. 685 TaxID=3080057 RepID=UPI0028929CB7|nr:HAD-IIB family hydrolase [Bosea sp. 685]WNJ93521.1 HAD-IIB family hydrolase [Bosea sp. 685]
MKALAIFDLDGTLAQSKSPIDAEMGRLLGSLLDIVPVAIISGGDWPQFETQVVARLEMTANIHRLSLLPTCGTKFYRYTTRWEKLYSDDLAEDDKDMIVKSIALAVAALKIAPDRIWGPQIEDRGSQITFSAIGQQAPLDEKAKWDPDFAKRKGIKALLDQSIPDFSVRLGGTTSVDVTRPGIDKAYGIRKLRDVLGVRLDEMIFAGDALFPGGNDEPVKDAGVSAIQVRDPEETKRVIETMIACLGLGDR